MISVHHLGIWVRDLGRSGEFYDRILGFEKKYDYHLPAELVRTIFGRPVDCRVEVHQRQAVSVELFQPGTPTANGPDEPLTAGINHFSLKVDDTLSFCRRAREKGAEVLEVPRRDHSVFFLKDPDGILIEIKDQ
jgi:catechol 2,3-dioxygenase-like lactoylglutathione lyase family enzyme